ncbi:MAG: KH domain-containing protein [archaeon]
MEERKIIIPGETIVQGDEFLPGDGARREGQDIVACKYGLSDVSDKLVRVIPLSGVYAPRRGNVIIGTVVGITFKGWLIDFGSHINGFLNVTEVPRYIGRGELRDHFDFGDVVCAKVFGTDGGNVDLSVKLRGFGRIQGGQLVNVNPNKVPRVIGKEGSMVNLIKVASNCDVTVGQNGVIWVIGDKIEDELNARKIIEYVCENSFLAGLTEKVEDYVKNTLKLEIKQTRFENAEIASENQQEEQPGEQQ